MDQNSKKDLKVMEIIIVDADDWQGLYINGVLTCQGHSITAADVAEEIIERLPRLNMTFDVKEVNSKWMENRSDLPTELEKVKFLND